ncbi:MAG: hypothetical protein M3P01_07915 [Actinomycetota bacterium]|nr:hypothetical protein [Actinomycetota bacterium]
MHRYELPRLLPPDSKEIVPFLTDEVLDLYATVCEVLIWGDPRSGDIHVSESESTSKDFADWRLSWIKARADRYFASPLRRFEGSKKSVERKLERDIKRMASWLFLMLAERDLVIWHERDSTRYQKG